LTFANKDWRTGGLRERELAEQRAQDEALQAYFGQMSELILDHDLLRCDVAEEQCYATVTLAQARTSAVIERLDPALTQNVIDFLQKADLLGSDLALLRGTRLSGVDLSSSDLRWADLSGALLNDANLHQADLYKAKLEYATLTNADLSAANLFDANLGEANLEKADLSGADLTDAYVISYLKDTDLRNATLSGLDPSSSDLGGADLRGAKLTDAKLMDARIMAAGQENPTWPEEPWGGADLRDADLSGAYKTTEDGSKQLITAAELEQQTKLLEGATMPNGSKHP
jgi:uncharacterized protein YjbI with pentapeptide repeats